MKKLLLLPVALLPYASLLGVWLGKFFPEVLAPYVFAVLMLLVWLAAPLCNIIFMLVSGKTAPHALIRAALIIKLIHIPAYIAVFIFALAASLMIVMTFPLIVMLALIDYLMLLLSGMISVYALARCIKTDGSPALATLVCQFFFCADVIGLLVFWLSARKRTRSDESSPAPEV